MRQVGFEPTPRVGLDLKSSVFDQTPPLTLKHTRSVGFEPTRLTAMP